MRPIAIQICGCVQLVVAFVHKWGAVLKGLACLLYTCAHALGLLLLFVALESWGLLTYVAVTCQMLSFPSSSSMLRRSRRSLTGSPRAVKKRQMEGHLPHLLDFLNYENPYLALWVVARAVQLAAGGAAAAAQQDA